MCNNKENEQAKKYRVARGEFQSAITNFNNAIKELEVELLKYQVEYPDSKHAINARNVQKDINGMYIKLTEIDTIILCYKKEFREEDNFCREFKISKDKKVTDAIKFYDKYVNMKRYLSYTVFSSSSYISKTVNLAFEELKRTFLAFADI